MPLYEYRCGWSYPEIRYFEAFQPVAKRDDVVYCPTCGYPSHRVLTPPVIRGATVSRS